MLARCGRLHEVSSPIAAVRRAHVVAGVSGVRRNAAVALAVNGEIRAFCEQERATRVRRAPLPSASLPVEALGVALATAGALGPDDISTIAAAEDVIDVAGAIPLAHVEHHRAHAAAAFHLSSFESAAVLVIDSQPSGGMSVWSGTPDRLARVDWPIEPYGLAALYRDAALIFGWPADSAHELEALARMSPCHEATRFDSVFRWTDRRLVVSSDWPAAITGWLGEGPAGSLRHRSHVAAAFQARIGAIVREVLRDVRRATGASAICLGGGLFYNTALNTLIRQSADFDDVFVPPNPGNAGTAIGAALDVAAAEGHRPVRGVSPFLGPGYDAEAIKRTLDNCKLSYECLSDDDVIDLTAAALERGLLVGWFQGRMEWGHRALGNRSILANPLSPYALDNLNVYLKHRERHRSYGVSVPEERVRDFLSGPPSSRYMEYEYRPLEPERFRGVMPEGTETLRTQTIPDRPGDAAVGRCRRLHERFGMRTGVPVLINTSFNGFAEPMAMQPRDAIRMFFGTGLDLLVLDRFVVRK